MSKKKRNDPDKMIVKQFLFENYGFRCWLCGKTLSEHQLSLHHVIPFRICKCSKIDNAMILCLHCHMIRVNSLVYDSPEYWELMKKAYQWKKEHEPLN